MKDSTLIRTATGRIYRLVGEWDNEVVFAPADGKDDRVIIYTPSELKKLLDNGALVMLGNDNE